MTSRKVHRVSPKAAFHVVFRPAFNSFKPFSLLFMAVRKLDTFLSTRTCSCGLQNSCRNATCSSGQKVAYLQVAILYFHLHQHLKVQAALSHVQYTVQNCTLVLYITNYEHISFFFFIFRLLLPLKSILCSSALHFSHLGRR